jgi:peptidylprolyl isomerase
MSKLTRNEWIAASVALVIVVIFFGYNYLGGFLNQFSNMNQTNEAGNAASSSDNTANGSNASGNLVIQDLGVGTGETAVAGDIVTLNYIGIFENGTKFDSSYDRGKPLTFTLGAGQVIPGWDLGIVGMKVGGKRKLTIPPALGYGANDYGPIPGNSTLIFEVELLDVQHVGK